jgi:hypothetical protein
MTSTEWRHMKTGIRVVVWTLLAIVILYLGISRMVIKGIIMRRDAGMLAYDLVTKTNSERLVQMPPDLAGKLSSFLSSTGTTFRVMRGDVPKPPTPEKADWHVMLANGKSDLLLVRLNYLGAEKFECLGFMEPPPDIPQERR